MCSIYRDHKMPRNGAAPDKAKLDSIVLSLHASIALGSNWIKQHLNLGSIGAASVNFNDWV
jgi:hypothetical protein